MADDGPGGEEVAQQLVVLCVAQRARRAIERAEAENLKGVWWGGVGVTGWHGRGASWSGGGGPTNAALLLRHTYRAATARPLPAFRTTAASAPARRPSPALPLLSAAPPAGRPAR
eukprot:scaffold4676_cov94-Isochrysis_galbana.AAC.4